VGERPAEQPATPHGASRAIRLPDRFVPRVRGVLAGVAPPTAAKDAATVVLLRPAMAGPSAGGGFHVYLLRRTRSMAFAPGAHVFPGGSVDPRDGQAELAWAGPDPVAWGRILQGGRHGSGGSRGAVPPGRRGSGGSRGAVPPGRHSGAAVLARALICAAVRETFEESGVLLAGPAPDTVVADTTGEDWEADRRSLVDHSLSLAGLLQRRGLVLRSDLLRPWARWVTPDLESRRFDTRFFAAELPAGQRARDVGGEADEVAWLAPAAAIAAARRGEVSLLPPTAVTLAELARHETAAAVLADRRDMTPRRPQISLADGAAWLTIPVGLEYPL